MDAEPVMLEARTDTTRTCPRCGNSIDMPEKRPGRRPIWCSPKCRRAASAERLAAARTDTAVTVVEVPRAHLPDPDARLPIPSMHTLNRLFLSSDFQCRMLLEHLERRYARGDIDGELRTVVQRFADGVERTQALDADPDYQAARTEVERLREYLRRDVERATERDTELAQLRHTAAQVYRLRARVAELEALSPTCGVTDTTTDGHPPSPPPARTWAPTAPPALPGLSRQQRRAAQRAATKNR